MSARYTVIDGEVVAQERSGVRHQLVPDPLGSTVALYDDSGTKTDTFSYWPYGEISTKSGTTTVKFQFIGGIGYYYDSPTRDYIRARYLDNNKSVWTTKDTVFFTEKDINEFVYVYNNPVSIADFSGLAAIIEVPLPFQYRPGNGMYGHAFIHFNGICFGLHNIGFYPSGGWYNSPGVLNPGDNEPRPIPNPNRPPVVEDPNCENKKNRQCIREDLILPKKYENNSVSFEAALCKCIKASLARGLPVYRFLPGYRKPEKEWSGGYVCGSWAEDMWNCAEKGDVGKPRVY